MAKNLLFALFLVAVIGYTNCASCPKVEPMEGFRWEPVY